MAKIMGVAVSSLKTVMGLVIPTTSVATEITAASYQALLDTMRDDEKPTGTVGRDTGTGRMWRFYVTGSIPGILVPPEEYVDIQRYITGSSAGETAYWTAADALSTITGSRGWAESFTAGGTQSITKVGDDIVIAAGPTGAKVAFITFNMSLADANEAPSTMLLLKVSEVSSSGGAARKNDIQVWMYNGTKYHAYVIGTGSAGTFFANNSSPYAQHTNAFGEPISGSYPSWLILTLSNKQGRGGYSYSKLSTPGSDDMVVFGNSLNSYTSAADAVYFGASEEGLGGHLIKIEEAHWLNTDAPEE